MNATMPGGQVHHYGFELVFFQALRSDLPPIYAAHFAISDVTRGEFHFDQRRLIEPEAVIPNGTSTNGIRVSIGDWSVQGVNGLDHLAAEMANYSMHVDLLGLKPATLHNGNGLITYGLGGFSYYYSRTRMALSGQLVDHHQPLRVNGVVWMDHQWGNFLTLGGGGWDFEVNNQLFRASLTLMPELKDQELVVYQSTGNSYWEGAVSISGQSTGQVVQGEGYVELTGYTHG